jgi:hypothetical protein
LDPRSGIRKKFIPDPDPGSRGKKHRIPDLDPGSATLVLKIFVFPFDSYDLDIALSEPSQVEENSSNTENNIFTLKDSMSSY